MPKIQAATLSDILGTRAPMVIPTQYKQYHDLLIKRRIEVEDLIAEHSKAFKNSMSCMGSGDSADMAASEQGSIVNSHGITIYNAELQRLEHALNKIRNGTYGICEETGKLIETDRLLAMPATLYSQLGERLVQQRLEEEKTRRKALEIARAKENQITDDDPTLKLPKSDDAEATEWEEDEEPKDSKEESIEEAE